MIVLLLLTTTALDTGIHEFVIADVNFIAAGAAAMPEYGAFCSTTVCWMQRCQSAKSLTGDVRNGLVLHCFTAAMGFLPCSQQGAQHFTGVPTATSAAPPDASLGAFLLSSSNYSQVTEAHPCEVMGYSLSSPFFAETPAA